MTKPYYYNLDEGDQGDDSKQRNYSENDDDDDSMGRGVSKEITVGYRPLQSRAMREVETFLGMINSGDIEQALFFLHEGGGLELLAPLRKQIFGEYEQSDCRFCRRTRASLHQPKV